MGMISTSLIEKIDPNIIALPKNILGDHIGMSHDLNGQNTRFIGIPQVNLG